MAFSAEEWIESKTRLLDPSAGNELQISTYFTAPKIQALPSILGATQLSRLTMLQTLDRHVRGITQEECDTYLKWRAGALSLHRFDVTCTSAGSENGGVEDGSGDRLKLNRSRNLYTQIKLSSFVSNHLTFHRID